MTDPGSVIGGWAFRAIPPISTGVRKNALISTYIFELHCLLLGFAPIWPCFALRRSLLAPGGIEMRRSQTTAAKTWSISLYYAQRDGSHGEPLEKGAI